MIARLIGTGPWAASFRYRDFRLLWASTLFYSLGTGMEHVAIGWLVYGEDGQLLAGSLVDYLLPTSQDIPNIESVILEDAPTPLNPLGVKGAGEGPIIPTGAALANAVSNAIGAQITELPLSPNRIRQLLRDKQS